MKVGLNVELQGIAKNENEPKRMKQVHKDSQYPLQWTFSYMIDCTKEFIVYSECEEGDCPRW